MAPNARIDVVWYDTRNAANNIDSQLFYSWSTDGGLTWAPNVAVSNPFNPQAGFPNNQKIGDYITIVSDNTGGERGLCRHLQCQPERCWRARTRCLFRAGIPIGRAYAHTDGYSYSNINAYGYCYSHSYGYCYAYSNSHGYSHSHGHTDTQILTPDAESQPTPRPRPTPNPGRSRRLMLVLADWSRLDRARRLREKSPTGALELSGFQFCYRLAE